MPNFEKRHYNYSEWTKARFSEVVTVSGPGTLMLSRYQITIRQITDNSIDQKTAVESDVFAASLL